MCPNLPDVRIYPTLPYCVSGYCGGELDWPYGNGVFRSVDTDKDGFYEPYQDCTWFFEGYIDIKQLNITAIDIQPDPSCTYDFLRVNMTAMRYILRTPFVLIAVRT